MKADGQPNVKAARVQQVRRVIDRLVRDGSVVSRADGTQHTVFPVAVSPEEGEALRDWVVREGVVRTIEVGLGYGVSALHICEGLLLNGDAAAQHVVLDPSQSSRFADCGLQVLEDAGVRQLVEHHVEFSEIVLPQFLKEGRRFDLGFIDGNHRFDAVMLDLFYLGRLVPRGGIVALDDYNWPGIKKAVSFFVSNLGWTVEETIGDYAIVLRTALEPDKREYWRFVEF